MCIKADGLRIAQHETTEADVLRSVLFGDSIQIMYLGTKLVLRKRHKTLKRVFSYFSPTEPWDPKQRQLARSQTR